MGALLLLLFGAGLATPALAQGGTASLTGKVLDITGAGVAQTNMELTSEKSPGTVFRTTTDESGIYRFVSLPSDDYALKLRAFGFKNLSVTSIHTASAEQNSMPDLGLAVGICDSPYLDQLQLLPWGTRHGDLMGKVVLPGNRKGRAPEPITGASMTLICGIDEPCGATTTDSKGKFTFERPSSGYFRVRVSHEGFYPLEKFGYQVLVGFEATYWAINLERCPRGNCDPKRRPKKPLRLCE